jgi:hypothetical protein
LWWRKAGDEMKKCAAISIIFCLYVIKLEAQNNEPAPADSSSVNDQNDTVIVKHHKSPKQRLHDFWQMVKNPPEPATKGKFYAFGVPVISASPTVEFLYGLSGTGSFFVGDPKDTRISSAQIDADYTLKKQSLNTIKSVIYTPHEDFIFFSDWRFLISQQPGFALGSGPQSDVLTNTGLRYNDNPYAKQNAQLQLLYFDYLRFYETAFRRVIDKFYLGLAYQLDYYFNVNDKLLNINPFQAVITNYYSYNILRGFNQNAAFMSGVSADALYDTRDNQNNPYKGLYAFVSFRYNPVFFGSDKNSSLLWLEYRDYFSFTHEHHNILAIWAIGNLVTTGSVPFLDLPAIGYDQFAKSGAGYVLGRFRGEQLVFAEAEYRRHLFGIKNYPDFFGMALFANMTIAGAKESNIHLFQYVDPAFGGGIRINISRVPRSNIAIDYAVGFYGSQGLYIRFNETF